MLQRSLTVLVTAATLTLTIPSMAEVSAPLPAGAPAPDAPAPYAPPRQPVLSGQLDTPSLSEIPPADEPPRGPVAKRHSVPMIVAGSVLVAAGATANFTAAGLLMTAFLERMAGARAHLYTGVGLLAGGITALAIGIPVLVIGARRKRSSETWVGAPGGAGWTWKF